MSCACFRAHTHTCTHPPAHTHTSLSYSLSLESNASIHLLWCFCICVMILASWTFGASAVPYINALGVDCVGATHCSDCSCKGWSRLEWCTRITSSLHGCNNKPCSDWLPSAATYRHKERSSKTPQRVKISVGLPKRSYLQSFKIYYSFDVVVILENKMFSMYLLNCAI